MKVSVILSTEKRTYSPRHLTRELVK